MRSNFALGSAFKGFLRKLAAALPLNLAVFWILLQGDTPAVLLSGTTGAVIGALLLMRVEASDSSGGVQGGRMVELRHRTRLRTLPGYLRSA